MMHRHISNKCLTKAYTRTAKSGATFATLQPRRFWHPVMLGVSSPKEESLNFHVNGNEPDIIGKKCQGFYLIQHQEGESITDQANVAFFKFDESWTKLHFDGNTIFWRGSSEPGVPVNDRLSTCLVLLNLCEFEGVIDHVLKSIEYDSGQDYVGVRLTFSDGKTLNFIHHGTDDYTTISC